MFDITRMGEPLSSRVRFTHGGQWPPAAVSRGSFCLLAVEFLVLSRRK